MTRFTRRTVLTGAGAAALVAAAPPLVTWAGGPDDQARIRSNTVDMFAGTPTTNASPAVAAKLADIDKTARSRLSAMAKAGSGELFSGRPLGTSDSNLNTSYSYLADIAVATRAPQPAGGSSLYGDTATQDKVIDGLVWLYDNYFGDQSKGYYGNWWNWEIGIPRSVSRILVLLYDRLAATRPDLTATYVQALDGYLRHGKNGDVDLDSRFDTGANLADMTTNRILQGAALGDDHRITKAVSDQLTVFATIDPYHLQHGVTDGYYADGSFIQHDSVAYTGAYGIVLLSRVTQTIKVLDGTAYAPTGGGLVSTVQGWVTNGFAPLIFEGWMMEMVKGRQVSNRTTGYANTADVVEAVVDLSAYSTGAEGTALRSYVKFLATSSKVEPNPASFASPVSILRYAQILADTSIAAKDINPASRTVAFNAMDRNVHMRPGWAFGLSRSSNRISKYEYMSGQNLMPWFQGDGAFYLYLSGQDQREAYGVDYFADVSPYRLSGVTTPVQQRKTIPELYGRDWYENPDSPLDFTSSSVSQNTYVYFPVGTNTWSGGATLDTYGIAGMIKSDSIAYRDKQRGILPDDFVVYKNAESTSSWIMLDDEIVVLTAGIRDTEGREVITTVDSRIADPDDHVELSGERHNGSAWRDTGTPTDLAWLLYHNADQQTSVGYALLDQDAVAVDLAEVANGLNIVRESYSAEPVKKLVFTASVSHGADSSRPGSVAYALVPNATTEQLRGYRRQGNTNPIEVLSNTTRVQAVRHRVLGLTAINTFTSGSSRVGRISVDGEASVIVRETDGAVSVAISDPTMDRDSIEIHLAGYHLRPQQADHGVTFGSARGGTVITADTRHAYGRSFTATLTQ